MKRDLFVLLFAHTSGTERGGNKSSLIYTLCRTILGLQMSGVKLGLQGRKYSHASSCLWEWHTWFLGNAKIFPAFYNPVQKGDIDYKKSGPYLNLVNIMSLLKITNKVSAKNVFGHW